MVLESLAPCQFFFDYQIWILEGDAGEEKLPLRTYHSQGEFVAVDVTKRGPMLRLTFERFEHYKSIYQGDDEYAIRQTAQIMAPSQARLWGDNLYLWENQFVRAN